MNQLNKLLLSSLALSISCAYAGTMGPIAVEPTMKEGLYVGAGIGGAMYNDKIKAYNPTTWVQQQNSFNTSSALASVFAGVGRTYLDKYYLGVEANSYFPSHRANWDDRPGVTSIGQFFSDQFLVQNYVNLDLLPGYRINPEVLVYGRVGLSFSNIYLNQNPNSTLNISTFSNNTTSTGGRFGGGLAYQLTDHVGAGVDYYYSYNPTSSNYFTVENTMIQLTSHMNYVGFSLFYTV